MSRFIPILLCLVMITFTTVAQDLGIRQKKKKKKDETPLNLDSISAQLPPTISFDEEEEEEVKEERKRKRKKKVFYGIKTKKGRVVTQRSGKIVYEEFYFLKEYREPNPYVRQKYFYDRDDRKIKFSSQPSAEKGVILHGPYKRYLDDQLVAEGIFFIGTKHGRWMEHFSNDVLKDKEKFYRGWPKESEITYHDQENTKVKEVIPVEYGKKEGLYFYFHDNGIAGVTGEYINGERVGVWKEFYKYRKNRRNRKKEIQYKEDPYDKDFNPYVIREWDEEGNLVYDRADYLKKIKSLSLKN